MKKTISMILCSALLAAGFTSCEMKDELWGKADSANSGRLQLALTNNASVSGTTRVESTDNGLKPGVFDEKEVDVNNYTLEVADKTSGQVATKKLVSELGVNNGKLQLTLNKGTYVAKAYNYDGSEVTTASTRPYFLGEKEFEILPAKTTDAPIKCTLQNIEVAISLSQSFKDKFKDDYEITVDNGESAAVKFTKANVGTKYYYPVPENKSSIKVSVKATTVATATASEQAIIRNYTITKPADAEGNTTLAKGDAFIISMTEDGSMLSHIDFKMSVDFSFAEQEETISIPTENITYTEKGESGGGDTPNPPTPGGDDENLITFEGLPAEYENPGDKGQEVVVKMNVEKGIKNLFVTITSDNAGFFSTLAGFGLDKEFDMANPGELEGVLAGSLDDQTGIGLLKPGEKVAGKTSYEFDVTNFMDLLGLYGNSVNTFSIRVVDADGNEKSGDLKVTISGK